MNIKKTLETVVVWYDKDSNVVSLAKCRLTGKFVKLEVAQGLLNVELNKFRIPTTSTIKVEYSYLTTMVIVMATLLCIVSVGMIGALAAAKLPIAALLFAVPALFTGIIAAEACEDHMIIKGV